MGFLPQILLITTPNTTNCLVVFFTHTKTHRNYVFLSVFVYQHKQKKVNEQITNSS